MERYDCVGEKCEDNRLKGGEYGEKFSWVPEDQKRLTVFSPPIGHEIQALDNMGMYLLEKGEKENDSSEQSALFRMATEVFNQSILVDPKDVSAYNGLGNTLVRLGRYEEAKKTYQKVLLFTDPVKDWDHREKTKRVMRELEESNP
ncbi:MAG: tetratricopeptide repeat protein [Candidatus Parcubacteria bacterium]|nr:tetratricopeptide repeat protein [Candidatus Parcubacteria bacterium]